MHSFLLTLTFSCTIKTNQKAKTTSKIIYATPMPRLDKTIQFKNGKVTIPESKGFNTDGPGLLSPDGKKLIFQSYSPNKSAGLYTSELYIYKNKKIQRLLKLSQSQSFANVHWLNNNKILAVITKNTGGLITGNPNLPYHYKILTLLSKNKFSLKTAKYLKFKFSTKISVDLLPGNIWQYSKRYSVKDFESALKETRFTNYNGKPLKELNKLTLKLIKSFTKNNQSVIDVIPNNKYDLIIVIVRQNKQFIENLWLCTLSGKRIKITSNNKKNSYYYILGWRGKNIYYRYSEYGSPLNAYNLNSALITNTKIPEDILFVGNYSNGKITLVTDSRETADAKHKNIIYPIQVF